MCCFNIGIKVLAPNSVSSSLRFRELCSEPPFLIFHTPITANYMEPSSCEANGDKINTRLYHCIWHSFCENIFSEIYNNFKCIYTNLLVKLNTYDFTVVWRLLAGRRMQGMFLLIRHGGEKSGRPGALTNFALIAWLPSE